MKKLILITSFLILSLVNYAETKENDIYRQNTLATYQLATVPGYRVVLNKNYAHYISKDGPEHFVITRQEYDRRYAYEKEMKRMQREQERLQRDIEKISKIFKK